MNREKSELDLAHKGMIPCVNKRSFTGHMLNKARANLKSISNFNDVLALAEIFQKRYPDDLTYKAHMYRFHLIKSFIFKNAAQLIKDGFAATEGKAGFKDELMDILCTLPYTLEETDKNGKNTIPFYIRKSKTSFKEDQPHLKLALCALKVIKEIGKGCCILR